MYPQRRYIIKVRNMYISKLEIDGMYFDFTTSYNYDLSIKNPIIITTSMPSDEIEMQRFAKSIYGKLIEV